MDQTIEVEGTVWGVFAHRFAIETDAGKVLADLGPHSLGQISLREGDRVKLHGERKRSEIKVGRIVLPDGVHHRIDWSDKHLVPADPAIAIRAAEAAGYAVTGELKRKPKHWEVPASRGGLMFDLHVELDGAIRKVKAVAAAA